MSALPQEPEGELTNESSDSQLLREVHGMLSDLHGLVNDVRPIVDQITEEIREKGVTSLLATVVGGMMGRGR